MDNDHHYQMQKLDGQENSLVDYYFDFNSNTYESDNNDHMIFVNAQRGTTEAITYRIDDKGSLITQEGNQDIFSLSLTKTEPFEANQLSEYHTKETLPLNGQQYQTSIEYLANYFIIDDLISEETFDNLAEFTAKHQTTPFIGGISYGLVFDDNQTLRQKDQNQYTEAGTYEIKTIDEQEILFMHPTNTEQYGTDNCYILDLNRVWEAKCYLKGMQKEVTYYDDTIYFNVLEYMQNNFVTVDISF